MTVIAAATRPAPFAGFGDEAALDLDLASPRVAAQVMARLLSPDFEDWSNAVARVGSCTNPIHLTGSSMRVDASTGEVLSTYSSDSEPLGTTLIRCGNRRASDCPSCSRVYAADMFHLIKAGVAGGKGVPERVGENPLVFATVTAPSFGHVHGMRDNGRRCRSHAKIKRCEHGRATICHQKHQDGDELLGQPLCWECHDYTSHIVWQWWAPELWRRFNIAIKRTLAHRLGVKESRLKHVACVQYSKVAEYQRRGLIHFHALVRLDGPKTDDSFAPAPDGVTAQLLAEVVEEAVRSVRFTAPPVFGGDVPRVLSFGAQVDSRPVKIAHRTDDPDGPLNAEQVAGYLAKYSTKSVTDTTTGAQSNPHLSRIQAVAAEFATLVEDEWVADRMPCELKEMPYGLLGKWHTALGFRGHFATKSRRYSVTLGALRRARRRAQVLIADAQSTGVPVDLASMEAQLLADDYDEATLVVGSWSFVGTGWDTEGDVALARSAAARAREYAQHRAGHKPAKASDETRRDDQ